MTPFAFSYPLTVKAVVDLLGYQVEWRPFLEGLGVAPEPPSEALLATLGILLAFLRRAARPPS